MKQKFPKLIFTIIFIMIGPMAILPLTAHSQEVKTPEIKTPEVKTPEVKSPEVKSPEVKSPEVKSPEVKTPETTPINKARTLYFTCQESKQNHSNFYTLTGSIEIPQGFKDGDSVQAKIQSFITFLKIKKSSELEQDYENLEISGTLTFYKAGDITLRDFYRFSAFAPNTVVPNDDDNDDTHMFSYYNFLLGFPGRLSSSVQLKGVKELYFSTCNLDMGT